MFYYRQTTIIMLSKYLTFYTLYRLFIVMINNFHPNVIGISFYFFYQTRPFVPAPTDSSSSSVTPQPPSSNSSSAATSSSPSSSPGPPALAESPGPEGALRWHFERLDVDASGSLGEREARPLRQFLRRRLKPRRCAKKFAQYCDRDQDRGLTLHELAACLQL